MTDLKTKAALAVAAAAPVLAVPAVALAEEPTTPTATSVITNMASSIATEGMNMIQGVVPVLVPLIALGVVVGIGSRFVKRFSKQSNG